MLLHLQLFAAAGAVPEKIHAARVVRSRVPGGVSCHARLFRDVFLVRCMRVRRTLLLQIALLLRASFSDASYFFLR